ncbi:cryptochrome/photolyase family protein [Haloferula sp. A504]|uniref:cryptochrome/photolyase family protein n=1 Tax=Haloferula sp. A504 TaxID=3373601 RepID=UPI0031C55359|nr:DNA photolyase family protein [Verrucomicrobiaceae bacterium E54]
MGPAIHWFRRDLRVLDNTALLRASMAHDAVVPCYLLSSWKEKHAWTGPKRQHFLCGCLRSLDANLRTLGGRLILRTGGPIERLRELVEETGATAIHFNRDPDPHGKEVERRLAEKCAEWGIECHGWHDVTLHTPQQVLTKAGEPYRVYTPYSNNWLSLDKDPPLPRPKDLGTPRNLRSEDLPDVSHWGLPEPDARLVEPGERAALDRLKTAVDERLARYAERRDSPSVAGTSRLSQDLRFGLLSVRTIFRRVEEARKATRSPDTRQGLDTFVKELAWREFYMAILHHFPNVLEEEFNPDWRDLPWDEPGEKFEAWKEGRTGFPIVDAGMRELLNTGFMHNRVRMITAMFLTKDLHLDWRLGESFFMQHLLDGEIASNNGGWQWSAGTGADAAPYFRIQNPWSQSKRHDPKGDYIRHWVPELADVPANALHEAPENGRPIADDYPLPCLDHKAERERTLAIFKKHRSESGR